MGKPTRKSNKANAIKLAKKIRRESEGKCERCGSTTNKLDGAHIIPVDYEQTAADLDNILSLCCSCHTLGKASAHNHPLEFSRWLDDYAPGLFECLRKRSLRIYPKVDWESKRSELKSICESLKGE